MKVDQIFQFLIKILVCISITNARSTEIKRTTKKYQIEDDLSNEDFEDQEKIILDFEKSRESEEPQILTRFQRKKEIDRYKELEDINENSKSNEIQEDQNYKTNQESAFMDYAVSNLQKNFDVAEDASRMISVIGSLEESLEDSAENLFIGKNVKNETKMFSKNRDSENEIDFNQILTKVNKKLEKMNKKDSPESESSFTNRIEVHITVDKSEIKNVQTLQMKRKTKKVINPHLGEKKSYFKYKEALKEKKARQNSVKEFTSKKPLNISYEEDSK